MKTSRWRLLAPTIGVAACLAQPTRAADTAAITRISPGTQSVGTGGGTAATSVTARLYGDGAGHAQAPAGMALIPAGSFAMGDHHGFVDPKHGSDETPVHAVRLDAFYIGICDVTTQEFCTFLNAALAEHVIDVRDGGVYLTGGAELLAETRTLSPYSRIGWDGKRFSVLDGKERHPIVCLRWLGAAAYCNWLSARQGRPPCYDLASGRCDLNRSGIRLPTEAEWEYAARGGQQDPYRNYPWGDEPDPTKANWPESQNPFRTGPLPWTTPVGFFDGHLHHRATDGWPGAAESFQTGNGANGFGLYDMAGNVWQFVNDWYERDYYSYSPAENPPGPATGSVMPDGRTYRGMRGGNWYNGEQGHSRVSNRDPSYFRGPLDPNHPYYHIGFRVVLPVAAESRPTVSPTPVLMRDRNRSGRPDRPPRGAASTPAAAAPPASISGGSFVRRSPAVASDGVLPVEFTGDGASATLPLEWSGAPAATRSYAVIMHHLDPQGVTKWYWILYDLPATVQSLPKNVRGIGTLGTNSINDRTGYAPPHSKGPGPKTYVVTVYALSAPPALTAPPSQVNRETLLAAIKDRILGTAELSVVYSRPGSDDDDRPPRADGNRPLRKEP